MEECWKKYLHINEGFPGLIFHNWSVSEDGKNVFQMSILEDFEALVGFFRVWDSEEGTAAMGELYGPEGVCTMENFYYVIHGADAQKFRDEPRISDGLKKIVTAIVPYTIGFVRK